MRFLLGMFGMHYNWHTDDYDLNRFGAYLAEKMLNDIRRAVQ